MLQFLGHKPDSPVDNMEDFRKLRSSNEIWNTFKQESTPTEIAAMELMWDIYECRCEIAQGKSEKLEILAENLHKRIPFNGLDSNDISWEALHVATLTSRVNFPYLINLKIGLSGASLSHINLSIQEKSKLDAPSHKDYGYYNHSHDNMYR
jgi:hypothetical protein